MYPLSFFLFYGNPAASGRLALRIAGNSVILYLYSFALKSTGGVKARCLSIRRQRDETFGCDRGPTQCGQVHAL